MERPTGRGPSSGINGDFAQTVDPASILVVKRDKVGDLLLATPMLAALRERFPGARIDVLASDYNAWVVEGHPAIDRLWTYPRSRVGGRLRPGAALAQVALWLRLRRERYAVAIAANGEDSPRATRRTLFARARSTIAFAARPRSGLTHPLAPPATGHECERMAALLRPLGIAAAAGFPAWHPAPAPLAEARAWLAAQGLAPGGYVVIGLGARRPARQPEAAQVLRWSAAAARAGFATVFMWTPGSGLEADYPGDDAAAEAVLAARAPGLFPFRGPLQPAAALAWLAARSIFPDSGLMHLAAASPGGVVGLFADTATAPPPERWAPRGPRATWLEAPRRVGELDDGAVLAALLEGLSPRATPGWSRDRCTS
jgi:heptosyltransferase III